MKKDFAFLKGKVEAVLLFGSVAHREATPRSDVDICVVAPGQKPSDVVRNVWQRLGGQYDVHTFEELPLHIKVAIMKRHVPLYIRDKYALYEYFYTWRKLWADQEHRQKVSKKELLEMM